ncbi:hypothetical protein A9W97_17735 [Mycobacterium gordonae]|nr:hypothetical protein [Mycobacterium gordonae]OBJ87450.1 hypothetical protein A9W97_17735 [Mycobacterium gordonae]
MARTGPRATALIADGCREFSTGTLAAILLDLGADTYRGVPCWSGHAARWAHWTVPIAYDLHYADIRPLMCNGGISRTALVVIAAARARYADYRTGRNCRPTNERLARDTCYTVRTVQRADEALRLLGVATEVLRGRQRTRAERFASWRVGDRARGWASVWALHDNRQLTAIIHSVSPHPRSGRFRSLQEPSLELTTTHRRPTGRRQRGAQRRRGPDQAGQALALAWRSHLSAPQWCQRHTPAAWARLLAAPARHGWTPRDLNQLVTDWLGVGHWIADSPHKPIGLLGAILAWHGPDNLDQRPACYDDARYAESFGAAEVIVEDEPAATAQARDIARQALAGPGRTQVGQQLALIQARSAQRRAQEIAAQIAQFEAHVAARRGVPARGRE